MDMNKNVINSVDSAEHLERATVRFIDSGNYFEAFEILKEQLGAERLRGRILGKYRCIAKKYTTISHSKLDDLLTKYVPAPERIDVFDLGVHSYMKIEHIVENVEYEPVKDWDKTYTLWCGGKLIVTMESLGAIKSWLNTTKQIFNNAEIHKNDTVIAYVNSKTVNYSTKAINNKCIGVHKFAFYVG